MTLPIQSTTITTTSKTPPPAAKIGFHSKYKVYIQLFKSCKDILVYKSVNQAKYTLIMSIKTFPLVIKLEKGKYYEVNQIENNLILFYEDCSNIPNEYKTPIGMLRKSGEFKIYRNNKNQKLLVAVGLIEEIADIINNQKSLKRTNSFQSYLNSHIEFC